MEVSSHSLDQNRVWGTSFNAAVLTNITREHLDYHRTMREYEKAKAKLFQMTAKNFGSGVINMNNKINEPQRFLSRDMNKYFFYGREKGANFWPEANNGELVIANNVSIGKSSTKFKVDDQAFHLSLPGEINLENALASICVAKLLQLPLEKASRALSKMKLIPGRMEKVENKKGVGIIIDYALTPDSMERLGKTYVADDGKNLIWVFGSCGERDRGKRPIMGEIASKYADKIILTNEDPYNENPSRIVDEIKEGIKGKAEGEGFWVVMDRQEAIKKALSIAKKGDIVLITGKGAEENMMIKGKKIPWSDKKTVQEALQNL